MLFPIFCTATYTIYTFYTNTPLLPYVLALRPPHIPKHALENTFAIKQIHKPQPLIVQMRAIARLATGQMSRWGLEGLFEEADAGDAAAFADEEGFERGL